MSCKLERVSRTSRETNKAKTNRAASIVETLWAGARGGLAGDGSRDLAWTLGAGEERAAPEAVRRASRATTKRDASSTSTTTGQYGWTWANLQRETTYRVVGAKWKDKSALSNALSHRPEPR
ncbi:hypothetical protein NDU88_003065 [Pleurodeles waltl]|uniref:Uncharacterized protein n=1 Tax=Pleurodeles waltl TaxID=8319 RepID=A0AAV7W5U1_PLEWA|nr:hypothetical protein NDU88_003065 [Pleurodeles waltl]